MFNVIALIDEKDSSAEMRGEGEERIKRSRSSLRSIREAYLKEFGRKLSWRLMSFVAVHGETREDRSNDLSTLRK